jgi:hypothetical protein
MPTPDASGDRKYGGTGNLAGAPGVAVVENHDEVCTIWRDAGLANRTAAHIAAHHDRWWVRVWGAGARRPAVARYLPLARADSSAEPPRAVRGRFGHSGGSVRAVLSDWHPYRERVEQYGTINHMVLFGFQNPQELLALGTETVAQSSLWGLAWRPARSSEPKF